LLFLWMTGGLSAVLPASQNPGIPVFRDVTAQSGIRFRHVNGPADRKDYIFEAKGGGVGFFDYDNDGWLDIYLVQGSTVEKAGKPDSGLSDALYRNRGDGTFEDMTRRAGILPGDWGMGVSFADVDNDGWVDIYRTNLGRDRFYRNRGDGTFEDLTSRSGLEVPGWSTSAAFGDYDGDGDLDLYVARYLDYGPDKLPPKTPDCTYLGVAVLCGPRGLSGADDFLFRNNGDLTFTDVTTASGARDTGRFFGLSVLWADLDNDHDLDICVGNDATPNYLFVNRGDGTFEEMGFLSGIAVSGDGNEQASMGMDAADYDNDGLLDLYMAHFAGDYSTLYHNEGDLFFRDVTEPAGLKRGDWFLVAWGTRFLDVNCDGWKDIYHSSGHVYPYLLDDSKPEKYAQPNALYLNLKNGTFEDVSKKAGADFLKETVSRGVAFGDYDNDGDFDLLIANMNGSPQLLRNDRTDSNHWLMVKLIGRKGNRDAIGARVTVSTAGLTQTWEIHRTVGIYSAGDPRAHFGLGSSARVERMEIRWPGGQVETFEDIPADRHYIVEEGKGIRSQEF